MSIDMRLWMDSPLDIKPHVSEFDVREVEKIGWLERNVGNLRLQKMTEGL